jgi:pimeloyl-ACP methyl ester carboxylesterase
MTDQMKMSDLPRGVIQKAYVPSRHGQLHFRFVVPERSCAPPLLCLHQTPSCSRDWEPIMEGLGQRRPVFAVDTPGYGMSDPPPHPISIEDIAAIMTEFIDHVMASGLAPDVPFDVMGYHTGSVTATEMARRFPERVRRCVLFGLAAYPKETREEKLANLRNVFPKPNSTLAHIEKLWSVIGSLKDERFPAEDLHVAMAESLRLGSRIPWGYISVYRYDFLAAMPQVKQATLVMNPEDDLWDQTHKTSHLFPNVRRVDLPGVSHGVLHFRRDDVVHIIDEFLLKQ